MEIDLIIPKEGVMPSNGILYEPEDVLVAIEIKNQGSFGEKTQNRIRSNSERITKSNSKIKCYYVTLTENNRYKWAITDANVGFPTYTLFCLKEVRMNQNQLNHGIIR